MKENYFDVKLIRYENDWSQSVPFPCVFLEEASVPFSWLTYVDLLYKSTKFVSL